MPFDNIKAAEMLEQETSGAQAAEPRLWPVYLAVVLFVVAIAASTAMFGLPGLYIPAVALAPVMYFLLIRISLG